MSPGRLTEAVIVDAVRTPIGRRCGVLSSLKPAELLRGVLLALVHRSGLPPGAVEQIIGGCVTQVGEQGLNVTRNAWLSTGLDYRVAATTVDLSCGSAQQANHLVSSLIASGAIEVGIACGVEMMSRVPPGTNIPGGSGDYRTGDYPWNDPPRLQFGGAERIAERHGLTRPDLDAYGVLSQRRAAAAWSAGRFDREVVPVEVRGAAGGVRAVHRDEGVRSTDLAGLAALRGTVRGGRHTAGTTSQVSDGAAAVLWMSRAAAGRFGVRPRARLAHQVVIGADPYYLLDGPTAATGEILRRAGMRLSDLDISEINEAFAAVVLSWSQQTGADLDTVNVNGGAIALGHPMGATGARLITTALHELERRDGELALIAMCCGGSMGTASILQRL